MVKLIFFCRLRRDKGKYKYQRISTIVILKSILPSLWALFSYWRRVGLSAGPGVFVILCSASSFFSPPSPSCYFRQPGGVDLVGTANRGWDGKGALLQCKLSVIFEVKFH